MKEEVRDVVTLLGNLSLPAIEAKIAATEDRLSKLRLLRALVVAVNGRKKIVRKRGDSPSVLSRRRGKGAESPEPTEIVS